MGHMQSWGASLGIWWIITGIFILSVTILIIYLLLQAVGIIPKRKNTSELYINEDGSPASPLDILNKRYAAGEITESEYEQIKKNIKS